ncbi:hypothetical protein AVEN_216961-1, partial [Araneus ventricosus]
MQLQLSTGVVDLSKLQYVGMMSNLDLGSSDLREESVWPLSQKPGCVNTTEIDLKKVLKGNKSPP